MKPAPIYVRKIGRHNSTTCFIMQNAPAEYMRDLNFWCIYYVFSGLRIYQYIILVIIFRNMFLIITYYNVVDIEILLVLQNMVKWSVRT
jgi:hypothetical protein